MTIVLHFAHWWIYVLIGFGGIVVGGVIIFLLVSDAISRAIMRGLGW